MKQWIAAATAALMLAPAAVHAQTSPMPYGAWSNADGSEQLVVTQGGTCQFTARSPAGATLVIGQCSWNAGSAGGILTIMNTNQYRPAPVYFNIVWINQNTISVFGDILTRRAG